MIKVISVGELNLIDFEIHHLIPTLREIFTLTVNNLLNLSSSAMLACLILVCFAVLSILGYI